MQILCPSCQREVAATDVNVARAFARCVPCGRMFEIAEQPGAGRRLRPRAARPARFHVERIPRSVVVDDGTPYRSASAPQRDDLVIEWRWFRPMTLFLTGFTVLWWGFLVMWYAMAPAHDLFAILFPLLHVGAGIFIGYRTIAEWLNRSRVELVANELRVDHRPLPWPGARRLRIDGVQQFYVKRIEDRRDDHVSYTYQLVALDAANVARTVLKVDDADEAVFLEQTLEELLGIDDKPVAGELAGAP